MEGEGRVISTDCYGHEDTTHDIMTLLTQKVAEQANNYAGTANLSWGQVKCGYCVDQGDLASPPHDSVVFFRMSCSKSTANNLSLEAS